MAIWSLYRLDGADGTAADAVLVRDGFCWPAAILGPLWAIANGLWLAAAGLIVVAGGAGAAAALAPLPPAFGLALVLAVSALVGWHGADIRAWTLERAGYRLERVIVAPSREEAVRRALPGTTP
jgi:hypothetical protein